MAFKYIKESVKNFGLTFSKLIVGCSKPSNSPPNKRSCSIQHGMIQDNLQWEHGYREINKVALINLDQSTAVNRLTIIYWRLSCPQTDSKWTHLLYSISGTMVEVKPFMLSKSIHQGCPLSPKAVHFHPMLYTLALEPFLYKLRAKWVLQKIKLSGAKISDRYSAHANIISMLVTSSMQSEEIGKEILLYITW